MSFVDKQVEQYYTFGLDKHSYDEKTVQGLAETFVARFIKYFKDRYDKDLARGRQRKSHYLHVSQSALSRFKSRLMEEGAPVNFIQHLHLSPEQVVTIMNLNANKLQANAIDLAQVPGDAIIQDLREFLQSNQPYKVLIALAGLTGRRAAELLVTIEFDVPQEPHFTNSAYWTQASGFLKKRKGTPRLYREIPLLERRDTINAALRRIRRLLPAKTPQEANIKYSTPTAEYMKKYCPTIGKIHQFRKFYALCCFHYFNDRNCSLPRLASDYLGHKTMSATVLTYLNINVRGLGSLNFS